MFRRIDTVFVRVRNLDEAVAWYTQHLGLEVRWRHPGVACLNLGETPLTLLETGEAFHPVEEAPFNFYAPDIEAELEDQRQQTTVLQNNAEFFFQAGLTDEAALNSACSEASTTSSWMPTPHTFCLEPKAVHSMYVAALTFLPPFSPVALVVMACSL